MCLVTPTVRPSEQSEFTFELSAFRQNSSSNGIEPKCKREPAAQATDVDMEHDNSTECEDNEDEDGTTVGTGVWTKEEHARFLEAIKIYANGPWKFVAAHVATRTVRQTMTHAQKYRQKAARRLRGLRTKQALMRMHYGHRITEESLVQERMRALSAQVDAVTTSPQALYPPATRRAASALRNKQQKQQQQQQEQVATATTSDTTSLAATGSLLALLKDPNPESTIDAAAQFLVKGASTRGRKPTASSSTRCRATKASKSNISPKTTETPVSSTRAIFSQASAATLDAAITTASHEEDVKLELIPMDMEILDDLSKAPSLEECAEMLYDLLCC
ncbi:Myb-like dna-binding protein [Globisporangium polare]